MWYSNHGAQTNNIQGCAISSVMDLFDGAVEEEKQQLQYI